MIKLLKHSTPLKPIYIAMSDDMRFHILYGDASLGVHNSIGAAVASIANDYVFGISSDISKWERLPVEDPNFTLKKCS